MVGFVRNLIVDRPQKAPATALEPRQLACKDERPLVSLVWVRDAFEQPCQPMQMKDHRNSRKVLFQELDRLLDLAEVTPDPVFVSAIQKVLVGVSLGIIRPIQNDCRIFIVISGGFGWRECDELG